MTADDRGGAPMAANGSDDELVAQLRRLGSLVDPVPEDVVLAGRSALAYRDLDVRLAELVEQSEPAGAGTRGDAEGSWFTFEVDEVVIELAVHARGGSLHLVGHVDGGAVDEVRVAQSGAANACPLDEIGRFSQVVEPGPLRVELSLGDGREVATSWILATPA